ncbi:MAG: formate dehydrogenase accessory protein FdhE [Chloroflexi bacterium]|nr:formate dehydrogenase accessory protein FdhE [Chloroflexota bacterium]
MPAVYGEILSKLKEQEQAGDPNGFWTWLRELLAAQQQAQDRHAAKFGESIRAMVSERQAGERVALGTSLISFSELRLDWNEVRTLCRQVIALARRCFPEFGEEGKCLGGMDLSVPAFEAVCATWYQNADLTPFCLETGVTPALLDFVLGVTFRPLLLTHSETLMSRVDEELWRRPYCPVCGGYPDMSLLDKGGSRRLVCRRCDARWLFQRLECPFCGNQAPDSLAYYLSDKEPYRVYICETCRSYVKAIDLRQMPGDVLIPLERITTAGLDLEAQANGYQPGAAGAKRLAAVV